MGDLRLHLLPAVITVSLLAGCTSATAGSPTSGNTSTTTTGSSVPSQTREPDRHGAPRVDNPLDATRFFTDPCAAIPSTLQPGLNLPRPGEPDTTGAIGRAAPNCNWHGRQSVGVAFLRGNRNGLADLYRSNASHPESYWEETSVEGYPAVFHGSPDRRRIGNCSLSVGLNDTLAMNVITDNDSGAPTCDRAKQLATVMVKTIKGER